MDSEDSELLNMVQSYVVPAPTKVSEPAEKPLFKITPWEELVVTISDKHHRDVVEQFSRLPINLITEVIQCRSRFRPGMEFPIRPGMTVEKIMRAQHAQEDVQVHSVKFMSQFHKLIPASVVYTKTGAQYTVGDATATVCRGIPKDQVSADLLSNWVSSSKCRVTFPVWAGANTCLGQFYKIFNPALVATPAKNFTFVTKPDLVYCDSAATLSAKYKPLFEKYTADGASNIHDGINLMQSFIYEHEPLRHELDRVYRLKRAAYDKWLADRRVFPVVAPVNLRAVISAAVQLDTDRGVRNASMGKIIFHRSSSQGAGNNYDHHQLAMMKQVHDLMPNAHVQAGVEDTKALKLFGAHSAFQPGVMCDEAIFISKPFKQYVIQDNYFAASLRSASEVHVKRVAIWTKVRDLAEFMQKNPGTKFLHGWKLEKAIKTSNFHNPDIILILVPLDGNDAFRAVEMRVLILAHVALAVEQSMVKTYELGLTEIPGFRLGNYFYADRNGSVVPFLETMPLWNADWKDVPFSQHPSGDALIHDGVADRHDFDYTLEF